MPQKKTLFAIIGSASRPSANEAVVTYLANQLADLFTIDVYTDLKTLPHFDPGLSTDNPPAAIVDLRQRIEAADGVLICTPEYVFSLPSGLKNAIEWCIATTVFTDKSTGLITASAHGVKGHVELQLVMQTAGARFTEDITLLIQGVKGKVNAEGEVTDVATKEALQRFSNALRELVH